MTEDELVWVEKRTWRKPLMLTPEPMEQERLQDDSRNGARRVTVHWRSNSPMAHMEMTEFEQQLRDENSRLADKDVCGKLPGERRGE
jgi:hypothetical protein